MDLVVDALQVATTEIEAFCKSERCTVEDLDAIMGCVAVHLALHEHCHARPPEAGVAHTLQAKVLSLYDAGIDVLKPNAEYKQARRAIMVETLARYGRVARD
jgi:hypothetical protein